MLILTHESTHMYTLHNPSQFVFLGISSCLGNKKFWTRNKWEWKSIKKQQTKEDFPNFHRASVNSTPTVWCFSPLSENRLCWATQLLFFKRPSEHPVCFMDPSKESSHLASLFKPLRTLFVCLFVFLLNQKMDGYLCFWATMFTFCCLQSLENHKNKYCLLF